MNMQFVGFLTMHIRSRNVDMHGYIERELLETVLSDLKIFPVLRSEIDKSRRPGRFILLRSASKELINISSESLAGRIKFLELNPFSPSECAVDRAGLIRLLNRGGFPESFLAGSDKASFRWRTAFIKSYVERDLPLLGLKAPTPLIDRLFRMLAHLQGEPLNSHKLAESLGSSPSSIRNYLDFLEEALLIRQLPSWAGNLKKRLVKAPRIYIRDTGIAWMLLGVGNANDMMAHPGWGAM
jgi:predicted AAA+ superfamily ATPase